MKKALMNRTPRGDAEAAWERARSAGRRWLMRRLAVRMYEPFWIDVGQAGRKTEVVIVSATWSQDGVTAELESVDRYLADRRL